LARQSWYCHTLGVSGCWQSWVRCWRFHMTC
jgi:hypothetical protein